MESAGYKERKGSSSSSILVGAMTAALTNYLLGFSASSIDTSFGADLVGSLITSFFSAAAPAVFQRLPSEGMFAGAGSTLFQAATACGFWFTVPDKPSESLSPTHS